jgi:hypothetical protein
VVFGHEPKLVTQGTPESGKRTAKEFRLMMLARLRELKAEAKLRGWDWPEGF